MSPATRTYRVTGMSCEHCVRAVTEEVGGLTGVAGVTVDLGSGRVDVTGDGLRDDDVLAAVREAGYDAVPADDGQSP